MVTNGENSNLGGERWGSFWSTDGENSGLGDAGAAREPGGGREFGDEVWGHVGGGEAWSGESNAVDFRTLEIEAVAERANICWMYWLRGRTAGWPDGYVFMCT